MERLNLKQYRLMVEEIIEYKKQHGKMPPYILIEGFRISKKDYVDMMERVNKFILEMGRNPRTIDIKSSSNNLELKYK
ncbi:MAG: pseudomurein-binding repeat-containing protein [Methanobacterium sp.]